MSDNDLIIERLTTQSGELREKIEREILALEGAIQQVLTDVEDHNHFEKTAEALTRRSDRPYRAHVIADPLAGVARFFIQEQTVFGNGSQPTLFPLPPPTPKITKMGVMFKVIKTNPGLKSRAIFDKIAELDEKENPLTIGIDDIYRGLTRVMRKYGVWRDKYGRYFPPGHSGIISESEESE